VLAYHAHDTVAFLAQEMPHVTGLELRPPNRPDLNPGLKFRVSCKNECITVDF